MHIIWSILLLALATGGGDNSSPVLTGTSYNRMPGILQSSYHTFIANAAQGRLDNPLPPKMLAVNPQTEAPVVKGIYVTAYSAGGARMDQLIDLLDSTELNSMVIDVKDDTGYITYKTDQPKLQELGNPQPFIRDIHALMERLEKHDIYPIARVVVFKDSILAKKHPEYSFVHNDGSVWSNNKGDSFVNPYSQEVWEYNLEIAKEAAKLGFKEIQFDYVRFPEGFEKRADSLKYRKDERSRVGAVTSFVKYAKEELEPLRIKVSVDIFGYAASVPAAEGIGQDFVKISEHVDIICPMIYPSHYTTGWFNAKDPDKAPYQTIRGATMDTQKKLEPLGDKQPLIRPWIQDFTASWLGKDRYIHYGKHEIEEQIRALKDLNVDEYLLWNASNRYTSGVTYK
ncbi:putative glycoside hydrolase [Paenibacillus ihumii]|uniref:putative glycoside hydrolase n=1 Tax=Paenibacillus ihumii TaxID=687436 RepID=UPI0006D8194D|nr:putative glycoside hydrolase [Paenibacillus ihumii]